MSDLNDPLKESYIAQVANALKPYVNELKAKDYDPTNRIAQLDGAGEDIKTKGKDRSDAEKALATAVKLEHDTREGYYTLAAATISLTEGLLGKDHALPVKLRGLRADLIGNQNPGGSPAPAPAPTPAPGNP